MLQDEFVDAPYVVDQLLGNAGFERKVKHFVSAFVNEGRKRSECSENLRLILEKKWNRESRYNRNLRCR